MHFLLFTGVLDDLISREILQMIVRARSEVRGESAGESGEWMSR